MSTKGEFTREDQKELQRLFENAKSGLDEDIEALVRFEKEKKIEPDEEEAYLSMKIEPETMYEKRQEMKGKPADLRKGTEAIGIKDIASAYGVDLDIAEKEGDLEKGKLQSYLDSRYVMRPHPNESRDEFVQRNINAFEKLGLNWYNQEDRNRVWTSMQVAEQLDAREGIAEEATSGPMGLLRQLVAPRLTEHAVRDILEGEKTDGYLKDYFLDLGENVLQTFGTPVTGILGKGSKSVKAVKTAQKAAQKAAQTAEKAEGAMTAAERAKKAGKGLKTLAGIGGDAAAVPLLMEIADAAAYDEEETPRGEFSPEDVIVGAGTNVVTPLVLSRFGSRGVRTLGEDASKAQQAIDEIKEAVNIPRLTDYLVPYGVNKFGRSERASMIPGVGAVREERQKDLEKREKRETARLKKEAQWSKGLSIPWPGDRDYEDYIKFKKRLTERMMLRDYVE